MPGIRAALAACLLLSALPAHAAMTDTEIRQAIVDASVAAYRQKHPSAVCVCPYDKTKAGATCGGTSAYSKAGGDPVLCYPDKDVTDAMVAAWRAAHPEPAPQPEPTPTPTPPAPDPTPVPPAPVPTPVPAPRADNTVTITNASGAAVANYPLQFGRPFVCGEIKGVPRPLLNGTAPVAWQADVKNRCPDGSVKFAVIAAVIPSLPASGNVVLTFQDQPTGANEQIAVADLLAQFPDFDASISLTNPANGTTVSASARKMLVDGACKLWTTGGIAQTLECADTSPARPYDIGFSDTRSFQPRFVLTFWPATKQVFIRYVGEISNSRALEAFLYDLELTAGLASPATVYTQTNIRHSIGTRWTRTTWLGGAPEPKINIDHNVGYLADTRLIPNYDRTLKIPESVTAAAYAGWLATDRAIGGGGYWVKAMPQTGYQPNIGLMPLWMNRALWGDWRNREIALSQADLAGAWSMQVRQGDPTKFADRAKTIPALGLPIGVYSNPSLWLFDDRAVPKPEDALKIVSPSGAGGAFDLYGWSGWSRDGAHQPDPFSTMYLLTGDPFYLEGLQFWAAANSLNTNPGTGYLGRSGPYAFIYDQVRGEGWTLRTYANAARLSPDGDPFQAVFVMMMDDVLARWEGKYGVNGTKYENSPTWKIGRKYLGTPEDGFRGLGPSPLGWWSYDGYGPAQMNPTYYDMTVAASGQAPWQQDFMILALGRAVELGFPADALLAIAGQNVIGRLTGAGYNPFLIGEYIVPDVKVDGKWFASWAETLTGWTPKFQALNVVEGYWPSVGQEIYWDVARGTVGMVSDKLPGGGAAWLKINDVLAATVKATGKAPDWNIDPTWAIVPRTVH